MWLLDPFYIQAYGIFIISQNLTKFKNCETKVYFRGLTHEQQKSERNIK